MLDRGLQWAYGRWGARYPKAALAIQFQAAHFVALAGVALLTIYVSMPDADLLRILIVTQALILFDNLVALKLIYRMLRPVRAWLRGNRNVEECERVELKGKTDEVRPYSPLALGVADYAAAPAQAGRAPTPD
jgi:hypothetical protein